MKLPYDLRLLYRVMLTNNREVTSIHQDDDLVVIRTTKLGIHGFRTDKGRITTVFIDPSTNQEVLNIGAG